MAHLYQGPAYVCGDSNRNSTTGIQAELRDSAGIRRRTKVYSCHGLLQEGSSWSCGFDADVHVPGVSGNAAWQPSRAEEFHRVDLHGIHCRRRRRRWRQRRLASGRRLVAATSRFRPSSRMGIDMSFGESARNSVSNIELRASYPAIPVTGVIDNNNDYVTPSNIVGSLIY